MERLTPEHIAQRCNDLSKRSINRMFLEQDDSNLWPINGKFNATKRAIRRARWFENETGELLEGLEYALFL